jgi:ribosome-binding factor A
MTSQRQLRVGEELRHVLSKIMNEGGSADPDLYDINITVTEVRISPDLRNATVFVMPLGGKGLESILPALKRAKSYFRHEVAKAMRNMRNVPDLRFAADESFDQAAHIEKLLKDI